MEHNIEQQRSKNGSEHFIYQTNSSEVMRRTNSVFLICAYLVVCKGMTGREAYSHFSHLESAFVPYRDASSCISLWSMSILDSLQALEMGTKLGFWEYQTFDVNFYEHYEKVCCG